MNVLVTGAAGFIGMHLCERLLAAGHAVTGLDNFNDYYSVALKQARHARLAALPGYSGHALDLCDAGALAALVRDGHFDVVCNLAAQAGVRHSLSHPQSYVKSNLEGFVNVLEACRHQGVRRLVYASSSSVYGGNTKLPFAETDRVDHPVSLYAATKKANELLAHTYSHLFGLQTVGLRFFTVYGPWGRPDMAMWLFTDALLRGRPLQVFNHGRMRRDFTYIDDIVRGVVAAIEAPELEPCELFNIGHNHPEELLEVIRVLGAALHIEPRMELLPMPPGDVPATYADITAIRTRLGYRPTTSIHAGIPRFVAWYRQYHGI